MANCDVVTKGYLDVNLAIIGPQTLQCWPVQPPQPENLSG